MGGERFCSAIFLICLTQVFRVRCRYAPQDSPDAVSPICPEVKSLNSTIKTFHPWNAKADAKRLYQAMKGAGSDKQAIIDVLTHRTYEQRDEIANVFYNEYGYDFRSWLFREIGEGVFREIIHDLMYHPTHILAGQLSWAMEEGDSKNFTEIEQTLIGILVPMNGKEMTSVKTLFKQKSGHSLLEYIESLTLDESPKNNTDFRDILTALIDRERPDDKCVDISLAKMDAYRLQGSLADTHNFVARFLMHKILTSRSWVQLKKTFEIFEEVYGTTFEQRMNLVFEDEYRDTLKAIYQYAMDSNTFFVMALHRDLDNIHSMKWGGTYGVSRVFTWRSEIDLGNIAAAFQKKYKTPLVKYVRDEVRGWAEDALVGILN